MLLFGLSGVVCMFDFFFLNWNFITCKISGVMLFAGLVWVWSIHSTVWSSWSLHIQIINVVKKILSFSVCINTLFLQHGLVHTLFAEHVILLRLKKEWFLVGLVFICSCMYVENVWSEKRSRKSAALSLTSVILLGKLEICGASLPFSKRKLLLPPYVRRWYHNPWKKSEVVAEIGGKLL